MGVGLQVWDEGGTLTWDATTRGGTILGFVDPVSANGQLVDARLKDKWAFCFVQAYTSYDNPAVAYVDGTTLYWKYPSGTRDTCRIVYGVY